MNIVITGAGGVLCSAFARALAADGHKVALLDLNLDAAEKVAAEIRAAGGDAGNYRGLYAHLRYEIKLGRLTGSDWLKGGALSFQGEYLGKGNYFDEGDRNPALFGRVQLAWKF